MGTLPNTMMLTLFREPAEYMLCFRAYILNESPLQVRPLSRMFQRETALF